MTTVNVKLNYVQMVPCKRVAGFFNCSIVQMTRTEANDLVKAGFAARVKKNPDYDYEMTVDLTEEQPYLNEQGVKQ